MSLTKKDPSMRVAANDPHLVSLGGGRLSTAVTIHNIPIGDTTIGSSGNCNISLNGSGVLPIHCTIYRSEQNEVTLVPERDARLLIDGVPVLQEADLIQGAMITIGNSYYLRYNNPAEAQMIRSVMGSNERISMPQIDFTQLPKQNASAIRQADLEAYYDANINPAYCKDDSLNGYDNVPPVDINGLQCPKVFTADLITVNMPAKDVLGQKYANFARNFAENQRNDKHAGNSLRNNQMYSSQQESYANIPDKAFVNNSSNMRSNAIGTATTAAANTELLPKVYNLTPPMRAATSATQNHQNATAFDCYPKPGAYGGLQIYAMNGINNDINNETREQKRLPHNENEVRLEDMIKICTEYADRQNSSCNNSITSSPIVQNRIKTNGSLPREKKSPFVSTQTKAEAQSSTNTSISAKSYVSSSTGYENVCLVAPNRFEINGSTNTGYENMVIGKYVPQSPRTKIRTICLSPKKEQNNDFATNATETLGQTKQPAKRNDYDQLIKNFEVKLQQEMQAIEESSRHRPSTATVSAEQTPVKRSNRNINNLKLDLHKPNSAQSSPKLSKKPAPAPRTFSKADLAKRQPMLKSKIPIVTFAAQTSHMDVEQLKNARKDLLKMMQMLKNDITELQKQEDEVLRELDLEEALVTAEVNSVEDTVDSFRRQLHALQNKIHRLEAQRNATRVMEENQQAKLKQSIEMKQDQINKLNDLLKHKPNNECLKEELGNVTESLENDRKTFEDLEFQYLEEESEWHAYREELSSEEKLLSFRVEETSFELKQLATNELQNQTDANSDAKTIKNKLNTLHNRLKECQERVKIFESSICDMTGQLRLSASSDEDENAAANAQTSPSQSMGVMSQSLFGSAELLCPKRSNEDIMSKSVNENMFYNSKIELPATSTPKQPTLKAVNIEVEQQVDTADPLLRLKYNVALHEEVAQNERVKLNLSLGSDDFEVNPLEKRVPSQDDIDRICKVASDAPISTKGASTKIFDSIKEIERNRQLLLAQQGHHVIEHERQKMQDLKKKSHDEARAQYLSMMHCNASGNSKSQQQLPAQELQTLNEKSNNPTLDINDQQKYKFAAKSMEDGENTVRTEQIHSQQRLSQPEFESQHRVQQRQSPHSYVRPLSDANSELSCDLLSDQKPKSASKSELFATTSSSRISGSANQYLQEQQQQQQLQHNSGDEAGNKRCSVNSNETVSAGTGTGSGSGSGSGSGANSTSGDRKRMALPKHQRPLTRYLPIFSPDLNLRHHIESAGHQIALCPHVFVDAYSCRGYLHKLGATFHGWARRWFVLDRQRTAFIYYADKAERKPRGGAYFSTIDEVYLDHLNASKSGRPHCTFVVKTKKRSYHLQAASDAAARIWIDAIITGAQGNLDY